MFRIVICSATLIAFIIVVKAGLTSAFADFGFWPGAATGIGFIITCGIIAFSWDYFEDKRSQE